ncbi:MAG TPA: 3'-5' exonuclease [Oculatellaceae cyanobacterium]
MTAGAAMENDLLARLNAEQKEAVTLKWGPALILAGAGSGKTTVLTRRIAFLISQLNQDPESILAVTFTNKAAGEMKKRIEGLLGYDIARRLTIGTFHSICARILRREIDQYVSPEGWRWSNNFVIYDETDSLSILKAQIQKLNLDDKVFVPRNVRHEISALKNDGFTSAAYNKQAKTYRENRIAEVFAAYQSDMARNNALDFDDLILIFNDLMTHNPDVLDRQRYRFRNVLVDEFQDTNRTQYDLVNNLCSPTAGRQGRIEEGSEEFWEGRTLMVVGDVDQSIYSWRKADFRICLGFQNDFKAAKLIKLEENYRSTSNILDVANSIIQNNTERIEKVLRCNRGKGGKAQFYEAADEIDESYYVVEELKRLKARGKNLKDCLILYRTNAQSRAIEEILVRNHVPYIMVGGTRFYERQEIKDVIAYLKLIYNPRDGQAFNRVINVPKRGIGKTSLEKLGEFADRHNITYIEAALSSEQVPDLSPKTARAIKDFAEAVQRWQMFSQMMKVSELLETVLKEIAYIERLEEDANSNKDELALGRIENVRELIVVAKEFEETADEPDLDSFLTRISLVSDLDAVKESEDSVTLMTLHAAKGLEFSVVFLMGLEEGLFPHMRSLESEPAIEEERRLMYVGVTRAEDMLYLTLARKRMMIGRGAPGGFSTAYSKPSRFLAEITPGLVTGYYPQPEPEAAPVEEYDEFSNNSRFGNKQGNNNNRGYKGYESKYGGSGYGNSGYGNQGQRGSGYGNSYNNNDSRYGNRGYDGGGSKYGDDFSSRSPARNSNPPAKPRAMRMNPGTAAGASRMERFIEKEATQSNAAHAPKVEFEHLKVGDVVQHTKFGTGTVTQVIGEKDKELYNIEFEGANKRLLDPRFAKLIKLS